MERQQGSRQQTRQFARPVHAHGAWAAWWRAWYRLLRVIEIPLMRWTLRRGFGNLVVLHVRGRRSGIERSVPLGLLRVGDGRYLGHPSGDTGWTLNLRAAGRATIENAHLAAERIRITVLERGPERDAVIAASFRQHPFPGNVLYRLAAGHVVALGVFFRVESGSPPGPGSSSPTADGDEAS